MQDFIFENITFFKLHLWFFQHPGMVDQGQWFGADRVIEFSFSGYCAIALMPYFVFLRLLSGFSIFSFPPIQHKACNCFCRSLNSGVSYLLSVWHNKSKNVCNEAVHIEQIVDVLFQHLEISTSVIFVETQEKRVRGHLDIIVIYFSPLQIRSTALCHFGQRYALPGFDGLWWWRQLHTGLDVL